MDNKIYGSIKEQALAEVNAEDRKIAVVELKRLYKQLKSAELVVSNTKREIEDYVAMVEQ